MNNELDLLIDKYLKERYEYYFSSNISRSYWEYLVEADIYFGREICLLSVDLG